VVPETPLEAMGYMEHFVDQCPVLIVQCEVVKPLRDYLDDVLGVGSHGVLPDPAQPVDPRDGPLCPRSPAPHAVDRLRDDVIESEEFDDVVHTLLDIGRGKVLDHLSPHEGMGM